MVSVGIIKQEPAIKALYAGNPNVRNGDNGTPFEVRGEIGSRDNLDVVWRECGICAGPHTEQRRGNVGQYHNVVQSSYYSRAQYRDHLHDLHGLPR